MNNIILDSIIYPIHKASIGLVDVKYIDRLKAYGHPNIRALHRSTIEITKVEELTPRGDCIIGVRADKSAKDLSPRLKHVLRRDDSILIIILEAGGFRDIVLAQGDPRLILSDERRMIIRRSKYVEPATIAVRSNKAARDLDRRLIEYLRDQQHVLYVTLIGLTLDEVNPINIDPGSII